jgi:hypothetical protein
LRLLKRILLTVVITLTVIFVGVQWIAPVALSFYAARKVPPVARIVPANLRDNSVSIAQGKELAYFGYEFEVPWSDFDDTQTELYPKDKREKFKVFLHFRSGLQLSFSAIPPQSWATELSTDFKAPRQSIESSFQAQSDYGFLKNLYEFSPDKMHYWALSPRVHYREIMLLTIKSVSLMTAADTGIFNIQNQTYRGFQQGDPSLRGDRIAIELFSEDGGVEIVFFQKDYRNPAGVTQPEINLIVQSLSKAPGETVAAKLVRK